jgi:hypothetical protein
MLAQESGWVWPHPIRSRLLVYSDRKRSLDPNKSVEWQQEEMHAYSKCISAFSSGNSRSQHGARGRVKQAHCCSDIARNVIVRYSLCFVSRGLLSAASWITREYGKREGWGGGCQ